MMKKIKEDQNVLEWVNDNIQQMTEQRAKELENIRTKLSEIKQQRSDNVKALRVATEKTDITAFESAKEQEKKLESAAEMYQSRYDQITHLDFVTEEESDEVLYLLEGYEEQLTDAFRKEIEPHLKALHELLHEYECGIEDAERTIRLWENTIHKNYRSQTTTYPDGTNRCQHPIAFHPTGYTNNGAAVRLKNYLDLEDKH